MTTAPIQRTPEEQIAELARGVPKPSDKALAFKALQGIIEHTQSDPNGPYREGDGDLLLGLARLYAHFLPKPGKRARTTWQWVAMAMAKDDVRYYLNYVYVTEEEIVATDGHRLHIAPNVEGLTPGYYDAAGNRIHAPDYARYPDFKRVQPDPQARGREWYDCTMDELPLIAESAKLSRYELPTAVSNDHNRVHINAKYVQQLFGMDPNELIGINVGGMGASVLAKLGHDRTAVLMPMRQ